MMRYPEMRRFRTAATLAIVFSLAFLGHFAIERAIRSQAEIRIVNNAQDRAVFLIATFDRTVNAIEALIDDLRVRISSASASEAASLIASQALPSAIVQVALIGSDGWLVGSSLEPGTTVDLSDREHFRVHRDGLLAEDALFVSAPVFGRVSQQWTLQFTKALRGPEGSFRGVIVASYSIHDFIDLHSRFPIDTGSLIALVGIDGILKARSVIGAEYAFDPALQAPPLHSKIVAEGSQQVSLTSRIDGIARNGWAQVSERYPFYLVVASPPSISSDLRMYQGAWWAALILVAGVGYGTLQRLEIKRAHAEAAARDANRRFREFGDSSSDVIWIRDAQTLATEYLNPAFEAVYGMAREDMIRGNHLRRCLSLVVAQDRRRVLDVLRRVRAGEARTFVFRAVHPTDRRQRWVQSSAFPLFDEDRRVVGIGSIGKDVTELYEAAERQEILVSELQHRSRNLISVVRSVSDRTLRSSQSLEDYGTRFRSRLGALARANGLLSRLDTGDRVAFDDLLRMELAAHGLSVDDTEGSKIRLHGPQGIRLRSASVQTLALALHELATNAVKHGRLAHDDGRLEVRWHVDERKCGNRFLSVEWREFGLADTRPGSTEAVPNGFGRELIERALPHQLKAEVIYKLRPEGVDFRIVLPI